MHTDELFHNEVVDLLIFHYYEYSYQQSVSVVVMCFRCYMILAPIVTRPVQWRFQPPKFCRSPLKYLEHSLCIQIDGIFLTEFSDQQ